MLRFSRLVCSACVAVVAAATGVLSGCAAPAAYLAAPDADADLANDGSAAAQKKLHDKYALTVIDDSSLFDTQLEVRNAGGADVVSVQDRNAADVLSRAPEAAQAINNWSFGMSTLGAAPRTTFILAGALTGAALGYWIDPTTVTSDSGAATVDLTSVVLGGVVGALGTSSILIAADTLSRGQARVSLGNAVSAYNRDIDARIAKGASASAPAPASTAAPASIEPADAAPR